jgi:hypothetical protein
MIVRGMCLRRTGQDIKAAIFPTICPIHLILLYIFQNSSSLIKHITQSLQNLESSTTKTISIPYNLAEMAPPVNTQDEEPQNWAKDVEAESENDERSKPWEGIVNAQPADASDRDVVNVEINPQGACDISVSA